MIDKLVELREELKGLTETPRGSSVEGMLTYQTAHGKPFSGTVTKSVPTERKHGYRNLDLHRVEAPDGRVRWFFDDEFIG